MKYINLNDELTTVYKAVANYGGSQCFSLSSSRASIEYTINEWSYPYEDYSTHGYYLFAFDTLQHAVGYYLERENKNTRIFECKTTKIIQLVEPTGLLEPLVLDFFRKNLSGFCSLYLAKEWPKGTIMCKDIMLIKECYV